MSKIEEVSINTIRLLSADIIENAKSGHPGLPLGFATPAFILWSKHMKHNPLNPSWSNRDRFVLSAGHGSALMYSLLHVFGYGLTIEDLKSFRKINSLTPGHPEYSHTVGVEVTTGPLGQGIANGVGMALAETYLAEKFNKPNYKIVDHYTYIVCGDGCLQEGVASEAASLAGTLGLGKIVLLYDSNNITIEGNTDISFTEDVLKRFEAYGWHTQLVEDGNDSNLISNAIDNAKKEINKPSIIEIKTQIGYGSPNKQGKASAHGEPLGEEELKLTKGFLGFNPQEHFYVPAEVKEYIENLNKQFLEENKNFDRLMSEYAKDYPESFKEWNIWNTDKPTIDLLNIDDFWNYEGDIATRISSEQVLNKVSKYIPNIIGGAADLAPSTKSIMKDRESYSKINRGGSNLHFGIREHAMAAMANGMYLHGGLRPYTAGFFVFSDYMKPALRLSALMKLPVIHIMTHDSIGVGEDGPTHQPIEQLAALRSIPNFTVIRPCDTNETAAAWYLALTRTSSPTAIVLTRQKTTLLPETGKGALKGGYVLKESDKATPDIILIASGSEVELIYMAAKILKQKDISARVISMISFEVFEEQPEEYKEAILPRAVTKRLAVEAGTSFGWERYTGLDGDIISIDTFGESGDSVDVFKKFGFTVENIIERAVKLLNK